jgi:hypothetical protein
VVTRVRCALYAEGMIRRLTVPLTPPGLTSLHRTMVLAVLSVAVPLATLERLVDPVTAQPHWLDVTGAVLFWPLLFGGVWWVWRSMKDMRLTPRMPFAWQMIGASMFRLIRVMVVLGVLSAVFGLVRIAMAVHAQERVPEELVVFGVSVLIGVGATFLLDGSAGHGVRR